MKRGSSSAHVDTCLASDLNGIEDRRDWRGVLGEEGSISRSRLFLRVLWVRLVDCPFGGFGHFVVVARTGASRILGRRERAVGWTA